MDTYNYMSIYTILKLTIIWVGMISILSFICLLDYFYLKFVYVVS